MRTALIALAASGCVTTVHVSAPATVTTAGLAPDFSLHAQDGAIVSLADGLAHGPVALVFYRGSSSTWAKHQLAELAHNIEALRTRGVTLYGISADSPEESKDFVAASGVNFPLISDTGEVAKTYVGLDEDTPIPGVVIIGADGHIAFRRIARATDDLMTTAELLATLDRALGTHGVGIVDTDFAAIDRIHSRSDFGTGETRESGQRRVTFFATRGVLVPMNRYLLIGPWLQVEPRQAPLDIDGAVMLRLPFLADTAALQLTFTSGWTPWEVSGLNVGARIGIWFATSPKSAIAIDFGCDLHDALDSDRNPACFATFGNVRMLRKPSGPIEP